MFQLKKGNIMDITLHKTKTLAIISKEGHECINDYWTRLVIYTDKGEKIEINLFGDKPLKVQLGRNEDD